MSRYLVLGLILPIFLIVSCGSEEEKIRTWQNPVKANLQFDVELNQEMYRLSNFGEPPQMALWLENLDSSEVRTLWVSNRLARGVWVGKVICPTALPYWISRRDIESDGGLPSFLMPLPDGITGATPKESLKVYASVEPGSEWRYYLELNVSGDYNDTFMASEPNGNPDPDGNGQPSLIYSGIARTENGWTDTAKVLGRTEQIVAISDVIPELEGYTTADKVLRILKVTSIIPQGDQHE